jgi:hypothetical protein
MDQVTPVEIRMGTGLANASPRRRTSEIAVAYARVTSPAASDPQESRTGTGPAFIRNFG